MPIIKKFAPRERLETFSTFINTTADTDESSVYFRISDLNETLTGGKNGFLIEGSEHLKETTELKIEVVDVNGNTIYYEPGNGTPDYYEGLSTVVSIHVYPDTPIGIASITILGELKTYLDSDGAVRKIPEEWGGIYNVKWSKRVKVNRNLPNEDKVRFYKRPTVNIDEIVKPIFNSKIPITTQSGSVFGLPVDPEEGVSLNNFTDATSYRLVLSGSQTWNSSIVGSDVVLPLVNYTATVLDIINEKELFVSPPYTIGNRVSTLPLTDYTSSFVDRANRVDTGTALSGSFAKIKISELKTFVGDVARVKVFRKSESSINDFEFVQEIELESNELLVDFDVEGKVQERYGIFTEPIINEYWASSSLDTQLNQSVLFNSVNFSPVGVGQFHTINTVPIDDTVEYTISFGLRLSGSYSNDDYIRVFLSGSTDDTEFIKISASDLLKEKQNISANIISTTKDDVRVYFEVLGGGWFINNVSLRASQETAFSPDEITFIQSVPRQLAQETFEYKFEFYDINNNYIPVNVNKTKEFTGGNTSLLNRSLNVTANPLFLTFNSSGESTGVSQTLFDIERNLLTGSVTFTSAAYDEGGNFISASEYAAVGQQYPGLLIDQTNESAVLTSANFTGSRDDITVQYIIYTAQCEDLVDTVLIGRLSDGNSGVGAGYVEASTLSFIRKSDKSFTPQSASVVGIFRDTSDFQTQLSSSILVYPSYSFDGGIDRNYLWYEEVDISPEINVVVRNGDTPVTPGESNRVEVDSVTVDFQFTDTNGDVIGTTTTLEIVSDGDKGDDTVSIELTPQSFVFTEDETGTIQNYSAATTTLKVLQGSSPLVYDQSLSTNGTWATESIVLTDISASSITPSGNDSLVINGLNSLSNTIGTIAYTITARPNYVNTFNETPISLTKVQPFTSVKGGKNARFVRLLASSYDVIYDADYPDSTTAPINPTGSIVLNAYAFNHTGSVFYGFYKDNNSNPALNSTNTQYTIASGDLPNPDVIEYWEVKTRENSPTGSIVAQDSIDIKGSKSGANGKSINVSTSPSYLRFLDTSTPVITAQGVTQSLVDDFGNPLTDDDNNELFDIMEVVFVTASVVVSNIDSFDSGNISFRSGSTSNYVGWDSYFSGSIPPTLTDVGNGVYEFVLDYEEHIRSRENLPLYIRAESVINSTTARGDTTLQYIIDGQNGEPAPPIYRAEITEGANVSIPVSVFGTPNFSGSGVNIVGYKDEIPLTGSLTTPTPTTFAVSILASSSFIEVGSFGTIGESGFRYNDISSWTNPTVNRSGFITYNVVFEDGIIRNVTQRLNTVSDGETGPGVVFRGEWTGSVDYKFQENNRRDAVLYNSGSGGEGVLTYYATLQPSGPTTSNATQPSGSVNSSLFWEELGEEDFFVAAKIAIFEESFVKNTLNVGTPAEGGSEAGIVINGRDSESTYISIGQPVIGFQQTGIFQGVSGSSNQTPYLSLQSATGSNGTYNSLEWNGEQLTIRGGIRQTSAGVVVTESINRGTWESGSIYEIGNIVQYSEIGLPTASYSAIQDHTASFENNPPSASFWSVFAVGKDGIDGEPGVSGSDAKTVQLTATSQVFREAKDGTIEPSSIDFTASLQNITSSVVFTSSSNVPLTGTGNTRTLTATDFGSNTRVTYTATADSLSDSVTVILVKEGSDAIQPILSNEAHIIPTDSDGLNPDLSGSGTTLQVFEGVTPLIYTTGTATSGQYTINRIYSPGVFSSNNITGGGNNTAIVPNIQANFDFGSFNTFSASFEINGLKANGDGFSVTKVQSFAKSKAGVSGSDGAPGLPGPGVVYRGEWATGSEYVRIDERRDVVLRGVSGDPNNYWIAKITHKPRGTWDVNTSYIVGDVVSYTGVDFTDGTYICILDAPGGIPINLNETDYWTLLNTTTTLFPPNTDLWEPFGATFTSIATSFFLTDDAVATKSISVGENASITIFGSGSSPYISIGQENGSQGFDQTGIFAGIVNDTGSLSLKSATDTVRWNGNTFTISGSNSSLVISGNGAVTCIDGGRLTTVDGVFQGRIDACAGNIGGFSIGETTGILISSGSRITLDGNSNTIEVTDTTDTTRFLVNTNTSLPSIGAQDIGILTITGSTFSNSISNPSTPCFYDQTATASFGILTPTETADYTIKWNNTSVSCAVASGPNATSLIGVRLRIECSDGTFVSQTPLQSILSEGSKQVCYLDCQGNTYYEPVTSSVFLPDSTFNLKAPLVSGSLYCVKVSKTSIMEVSTTDFNPDGNPIPTYVAHSINASTENTASYDATPTYTTINGGGFQAVTGVSQYLRVQPKPPTAQTVDVVGGLGIGAGSSNPTNDIDFNFIKFYEQAGDGTQWLMFNSGSNMWVSGSVSNEELIFATGTQPSNSTIRAGFDPVGNFRISGQTAIKSNGTAWANPSDERLKENVIPIVGSLDNINKLVPVEYTWKLDYAASNSLDACVKNYGFIAQQVEKVFPSDVKTTNIQIDDSGVGMKILETHTINVNLVRAVQELSQQVNELRDEVKKLKGG